MRNVNSSFAKEMVDEHLSFYLTDEECKCDYQGMYMAKYAGFLSN